MIKKLSLAVILAGLAYALFACGDVQNSVNGKVVSSLAVSPASTVLQTGSSTAFYANATFTDGTTGQVQPTWSVTPESLGRITSVGYAGILTASKAGTGEMIVVSGGLTAVATVTVTAGPTPEPGGLASIEVSPASLDMPVGGTQTFTASGFGTSGEAITIVPSWSLTGAAVGTFTSSGTTATLEATATGLAVISCTSGEITTTVPVTIEGAIANITVESDTYVDSANPATSFESQTTMKAGFVSGSPNVNYNALLRFSLASLPAGITSIEAVQLELFASAADSPSFQIYTLTSTFDATTSWNTPLTYGGFIQSSTFTASQYNDLNSQALLDAVRSWYENPAGNFGLEIRQDSTSSSGTVVLLSKENGTDPPILSIIYK